jgi:hypothetical protein
MLYPSLPPTFMVSGIRAPWNADNGVKTAPATHACEFGLGFHMTQGSTEPTSPEHNRRQSWSVCQKPFYVVQIVHVGHMTDLSLSPK